LSFIFVTQTNK